MLEYNPDIGVFMMCDSLNPAALSSMPEGYHIRYIKKSELEFWKMMSMDGYPNADHAAFHKFISDYYDRIYAPQGELFYNTCLVVADEEDNPVATCFTWKLYNRFTTVHWYKTLKKCEGIGIGRALFSVVMSKLTPSDYPVYLHTQTGSFRAIHLYGDFGFKILKDKIIGNRRNELGESLPILKKLMPEEYYNSLQFDYAKPDFLACVAEYETDDF
jgi:GNAT superfamily N-acetyltransferase